MTTTPRTSSVRPLSNRQPKSTCIVSPARTHTAVMNAGLQPYIRHSMVVVALQIGRVQLARGLQTASCKAGAASTCACLTATPHHAAPHWCDHGWLLLLLASAAMLCCQLFSGDSCTSYHMGATPQAPQESKARCWLCVCVYGGWHIFQLACCCVDHDVVTVSVPKAQHVPHHRPCSCTARKGKPCRQPASGIREA